MLHDKRPTFHEKKKLVRKYYRAKEISETTETCEFFVQRDIWSESKESGAWTFLSRDKFLAWLIGKSDDDIMTSGKQVLDEKKKIREKKIYPISTGAGTLFALIYLMLDRSSIYYSIKFLLPNSTVYNDLLS